MRTGLNSATGLPLLPRVLPRAGESKSSATGTQTRVARVRAEYPNQLDYSGVGWWILLPLTVFFVLSFPLSAAAAVASASA